MNKKNDKAVWAATRLCIVYMIGMFFILKKMQGNVLGFWIWVIWTLAVILYAVISDYIEDMRNSVHERIKEVSEVEMRFLEERKKFYEEEKGK